jgi:hypothetical protein
MKKGINKYAVCNIIEQKNGIIDNVQSFIINVNDDQNEMIDHAEKHFLNCCKIHHSDEFDYTDDELLEQGYYDDCGYSVVICWSEKILSF